MVRYHQKNMMDFEKQFNATLEELDTKLSALIDTGEEFDVERSGDVMKIVFEDGEQYIITPQSPTSQLWLSANYAGHRFNWSDDVSDWTNEKTGERFTHALSYLLGNKLNRAVEL